MLTTGTNLLLRLPDPPDERILHLGLITELDGTRCVAEFEEAQFAPEIGMDVMLFLQLDGTFCQQSARVEEVGKIGLVPLLHMTLRGEPVSAEGRAESRVSTVASELTAIIDGEDFCPLLDVSTTGFAVMASGAHAAGKVVDARLSYEGDEYTGHTSVQSVREIWEGRYRYGLYCVHEEGDTLKDALLRIRRDMHLDD
ncbi:MAG: hypothetical protein HKN62_12140 [Phycisphaerales bacterium]|nr:hypothetical protein [Phycisphaerales bacterium]